MPTRREADPVAHALNRAFDRDIARIAAAVGCSDSKVRSWRRGSLDLAPWVVNEIAKVLRLNDATLEEHRHQRRRHQETQRERTAERMAA